MKFWRVLDIKDQNHQFSCLGSLIGIYLNINIPISTKVNFQDLDKIELIK